MVLGRHKQKETDNLKINGAEIKGENLVTLLGNGVIQQNMTIIL